MVAVRTKRRFNVNDYHIISDAGVFGPDERTELIDGEVIVMAAVGKDHAFLVSFINEWFVEWFVRNAPPEQAPKVWTQSPLRLNPFWEPQPDIALLRAPRETYRHRLPVADDVLLVVEVSDSTLHDDLYVKTPEYGRSGIPEAWVIDVQAARVGVFRSPSAHGYDAESWVGIESTLSPLAVPELHLPLTELFGIR